MGYGDDIMALGEMMDIFRDNKKSDPMIAVGGKYYESPIYKHHPFLIPPDERIIEKYKNSGKRVVHFNWNKRKRHGNFYMQSGYKQTAKDKNIILVKKYEPKIADIYFRANEIDTARLILKRNKVKKFIYLQPLIKDATRLNKDWGHDNYAKLVSKLSKDYKVLTCIPEGVEFDPIPGLLQLKTKDLRDAMAILLKASLFIGNEGAMHHAAASFGIPGSVIFGHFISPESTGYKIHKNYFFDDGTEENKYGCGVWGRECATCSFAMKKFTPEIIYKDAVKMISNTKLNKRVFINPDREYGYMTEKTYGKIWLSQKYKLAAKKRKSKKKN